MLQIASAESLLGSIFFALSLSFVAGIAGYAYCRRQGAK